MTFRLVPAASAANDLVVATIWYCNQDHRMMWVISHLSGPQSAMLATHQRVVESVHCHVAEGRPTTGATAAEKLFPGFAPPPGFVRDTSTTLLRFIGPRRQTIVFDAAVAGRSGLMESGVTPAMIANLLKTGGTLTSVEGTPQLRTTPDLLGHQRRIWTVNGASPDGTRVQVEVMAWWCDRRDMTFVGTYVTEGAHDPNDGINALLPAVCHTE
jgi:hypothetical protein